MIDPEDQQDASLLTQTEREIAKLVRHTNALLGEDLIVQRGDRMD